MSDAPHVLHYRGDRTNYDPAQRYGPDRFGAYYEAIGAEYDAAGDRTTMTFRPVVQGGAA